MIKSLLLRMLPFVSRFLTGALAGVVGLAVIIWFGGRFVGLDSVGERLTVIGIVFSIYLLWLLVKFLFLRFRGQKLADNLTSGLDDDHLKQKLNDALSALKSTELGRKFRGKGALYALPWYMIIGPSAAGKSTFYSRSGLNFPFKDDEKYHLSGVGGTKDCDWWFSDEAVLIDTAGRYSSDEESSEWIHFLQLLKKNRPKVPVNGVVLALPIDELLTTDNESLQTHAHKTRNRLQEIMSELGLMVPVYIVITKCDMLRGFDAFFEDLSDAEASQPWGVYVLDQTEDRKADVVGIFKDKIHALNDRLLEQRTQKMMLAQSTTQKADIYQYPSQFSGASERLVDFIGMLFKDSPYHEKPWFAGVYFTSSVQEGEVVERKNSLLKDIFSKALGLPYRAGNKSRSYFISDFFKQVVFPLKDAVRGNRSRQRFHLAAKSLTFFSMVFIVVVTGLALTATYTANAKLMSDYEKKAKALVMQLQDASSSKIERVNALAGLNAHYQDLEKISTYSPLALFSRYDLIGTHGEPMRNLLIGTLDRYMQSQVIPYFQNQFKQQGSQWANANDAERAEQRLTHYQYLETYLMLTTEPEYYDRDQVSSFLGELWFESFGDDNLSLSYENEIPKLTSLVGLYLQYSFEAISDDGENHWDIGFEYAKTSQDNLITPPDASQLYQHLIANGSTLFSDVSLNSIVGGTIDGVIQNDHEFPGIFTVEAWNEFVRLEIKQLAATASQGDWVLGLEELFEDSEEAEALADKLERSVRRLYFKDYSQHWISIIGETKADSYENLSEGIDAIKAMSDEKGPLIALFKALEKNIKLAEITPINIENIEGSEDGSNGLLADPPVIPAFAALTKDLARLVQDKDESGQSDFLELFIAEIKPLAEELDTLKVASDIDMEARKYAAGVLLGNSGNKKLYSTWIDVNNLLSNQPESSRSLVEPLMTSSLKAVWKGMVQASERSLQAVWQDEVYRTYNGTLRGRFPFSENGVDANVRDIQQFLKPIDGQLWSFIDNDLKPFVQVRAGKWRVREWLGIGLSFDKTLFLGVNSASTVVSGLFDEYDRVSMRFWVSPVPSAGVSESLLEVDSDLYRYRNEPEEWREFNWSLDNSQVAQVQVYLDAGGGYADLAFDGPWAFLKLLKQSQIEHSGGTQFNVVWPMKLSNGKEVSAQYKVRADRSGSVLNQRVLSDFYLPRSLFKG
ncbi:type VI secretion system membrane subunit TssM [Reinekea forsetii]|nr:type VI secretion system membrane subunit TssM [Reinekea forsetii]